MKKSTLKEMNPAELETKLYENLESIQNLRFQKALQQLEDPTRIRALRREIAQLKTVIKEYDSGLRSGKGEK